VGSDVALEVQQVEAVGVDANLVELVRAQPLAARAELVELVEVAGDVQRHALVPPCLVVIGPCQPRRSSTCLTSSSTLTRACSIESRSRTVTALSSSDSKSTVTQNGVPISS